MAATTRLLAAASRTVADVTATPTGFRLSNATLTIATRHEEFNSPHVIGWLPGSDSQLRDEFVLYVAHLDGMGRGDAVDGDDIYNAAIDNGLGSAMLLTLAQTFTRIAESPKRSLIFLASTGEELGIVGTPYFVEHPTNPSREHRCRYQHRWAVLSGKSSYQGACNGREQFEPGWRGGCVHYIARARAGESRGTVELQRSLSIRKQGDSIAMNRQYRESSERSGRESTPEHPYAF